MPETSTTQVPRRTEPVKLASWKEKFSNKQLERERQADRINQQRARQRSRQTVAELESKINILLEGSDGPVVRKLLDKDAALKAKFDHCRMRLGSISLEVT